MSDFPHSNLYGNQDENASFLQKYKMPLIIGGVGIVVFIIILVVIYMSMGSDEGFGTMPTRLGQIGIGDNFRPRPNPIAGGGYN